MVTSDYALTLSLNSFDSCACIAENPSTHSAMMLSVKECEILPALHALVDLAVRDLPRFKRKRYILPKLCGRVHCSADSSRTSLLATDW